MSVDLREALEEIENNSVAHIHKRTEVAAAWARVWPLLDRLEVEEKLKHGRGRRRDML